MNNVPFVDLYQQYLTLKLEIDTVIEEVIRASAFIRGPFVDHFENEFAEIFDMPHCVSCANGTDALYLAMRALGVAPGDEVITSAHSWIATSETITQAGASVVFCDTDGLSYTIDPVQIEARITARTVGIIPVHLYGQAANMPAIMRIAEKHKLWVIEDCAQAHLAAIDDCKVGTFGAAATYSFYPGKNLGAMGDAGAILTRDSDLARRMTMLARHGGLRKGDHQIEGLNSRLDGLQAAILSVKLPHLARWNAARRRIAASYSERLAKLATVTPPVTLPNREHVFHLYVIQHSARDELARFLSERGIQTVINYPTALPFLPAYHRLGHQPEDFPHAWGDQSRILSLPIFPELSNEQLDSVVDAIRDFDATTHSKLETGTPS